MLFVGHCIATWRRLKLLCLVWLISTARALDISYCSGFNTGADFSPVSDDYQSNGSCQTTCSAKYAYAILQGKECWCSNYAPTDTTSPGSCNLDCPGFPSDKCGNPSEGLYGYFQLSLSPLGTTGASSAAASSTLLSTPTPEPLPETVTVLDTVTGLPSVSVSVVVSTVSTTLTPDLQTSTPPILRSTYSSQSPSMVIKTSPFSWSPTPYVSVTTVLGSIQTIIVTPTVPPQPAETNTTIVNSEASSGDNFFGDTGKVAGTFVAVALAVVLIGAAIAFLIVRRLRRRDQAMTVGSNADDDQGSTNENSFNPDNRRRSNLTLATAGMGGLTRGSSNEKTPVDHTPASMSRRTSLPLVHDQRLNPAALWNSGLNNNGSHVSIASFRDDRDYSRPVLHVRNPDE